MSTRHLPPERRSEIARNAGRANKSKGRGIKPCRNAPDGPHLVPVEGCKRCRLRESEKRSRTRKNGEEENEMTKQQIIERYDALTAGGMSKGIGKPDGPMCVEAAISLAAGEPFGDTPTCVHPAIRAYSIAINDASWSSDVARMEGLREFAHASIFASGEGFASRLAEKTIRVLIPALFREVFPHDADCLAAAVRCENEGTEDAAWAAAARAEAARAETTMSWAETAASDAAEWAAETAAGTAARAAARAAWVAWAEAEAARAAARAAWVAWAEAEAAEAAARAAWVARSAARAAGTADPDKYLNLSLRLALECLERAK